MNPGIWCDKVRPQYDHPEYSHALGGGMIVEYFPDTDMLHIKLAEGTSVESEEVAPGLVLDFDQQGRVIGVEIEDAGKTIDLSRLELWALPVADVAFRQKTPAAT